MSLDIIMPGAREEKESDSLKGVSFPKPPKMDIQEVELAFSGEKEILYITHNEPRVSNPIQIELALPNSSKKEGVDLKASFYGDTVFAVELPQFLELMVSKIEQSKSSKVDRASVKLAILETGAKIEVPPFIEVGDIIKVDTKTAEYIQRV